MKQQNHKNRLTTSENRTDQTPAPAHDRPADTNRAAWMAGGWGVMHHYRSDASGSLESFNEQTERFDVDALAGQLDELGARWLLFCLCHNATSLYWCSPNETLDRYAGEPVCTRRDLIADLAAACNPRGIRVMAYVWPWVAEQANRKAQDALAPDYPTRWCEVLEEYSRRWADSVSGWWVDGAGVDPEPNLARLAAGLRAGNPSAAVAFNGGWGKLGKYVPDDDYCAGEHLQLKECPGRYDDGALRHILIPIGGYWGGSRDSVGGVCPDPITRFTDDELKAFVVDWVVRNQAAVTLDVPFESYKGTIGGLGGVVPEMYYRQLDAVAAAVRR